MQSVSQIKKKKKLQKNKAFLTATITKYWTDVLD